MRGGNARLLLLLLAGALAGSIVNELLIGFVSASVTNYLEIGLRPPVIIDLWVFDVTLGFSILALSKFVPTIYFGLLTGFAMMVALVANLTLLPLLLVWAKVAPTPIVVGHEIIEEIGSDPLAVPAARERGARRSEARSRSSRVGAPVRSRAL